MLEFEFDVLVILFIHKTVILVILRKSIKYFFTTEIYGSNDFFKVHQPFPVQDATTDYTTKTTIHLLGQILEKKE